MATPPHLSEEELIYIDIDRINRNSTYGVDPNNHPLHNKQSVDEYYKTKAQRNTISGSSPIAGSIYHDSSCNTESINPGECVQQQVLIVNSDTGETLTTVSLAPEDANIIHQLSEPISYSLSTRPLREHVNINGDTTRGIAVVGDLPHPRGLDKCNIRSMLALAGHCNHGGVTVAEVLPLLDAERLKDYIHNDDVSFMYPHKVELINVGSIFPSVKSVFDKWAADIMADKRLTITQIKARDKYLKRVSSRCNNKKTYRYKRRKQCRSH